MTATKIAAMRRFVLVATPLALALVLPACSNSSDTPAAVVPPPVAVAPTPTPTPTPAPTPTPSPASRNVTACLNQVIPGTNGATPASLVIPDTIKLDLSRPAGFPNGRRLPDQVIDITLAVLFLDVNAPGQSAASLLGVNPVANDVPFLASFPFVAPPQGTPPIAAGTGTSFNFRTDPSSSYVRIDRNGMPAVSPAVIGGTLKVPYNQGDLPQDIAGNFVGGPDGIVNQLTLLHNALADDLIALGLRVCST